MAPGSVQERSLLVALESGNNGNIEQVKLKFKASRCFSPF